jgi:hypothetical protein
MRMPVVSESYQNYQSVRNQLKDIGRGESLLVGGDNESVDMWQGGALYSVHTSQSNSIYTVYINLPPPEMKGTNKT